MSNPDMLRDLFKKYDLIYDKDNPQSKSNDVYKHKHYTIITRQGIQKIERNAGIQCNIHVVDSISTPTNITMRGVGTMPGASTNPSDVISYQTFASASEETSTNKYYAEMCEKRCRSRLVLTLAGLYELGVFGEDEAESFSDAIKAQQNASPTPVATFKGALSK
jgi:hypothetical protein